MEEYLPMGDMDSLGCKVVRDTDQLVQLVGTLGQRAEALDYMTASIDTVERVSKETMQIVECPASKHYPKFLISHKVCTNLWLASGERVKHE